MLNDQSFINIAKEIAKASKCVSKQVGAVNCKRWKNIINWIQWNNLLVTKIVVTIGMENIQRSS